MGRGCAVVYDRVDALEAARDDLAAAYEEAGVRAWTVWVPDGDERAVHMYERRRA